MLLQLPKRSSSLCNSFATMFLLYVASCRIKSVLEELEYQMQKLHRELTEAIFERRLANSNDELMELEASVNATMAVLNKNKRISLFINGCE
ncbi:hypothetical protein L1887_37088 [Cichorium endivia]|nr:hypothetical protein L1887_37088 [Cichorium endivia]